VVGLYVARCVEQYAPFVPGMTLGGGGTTHTAVCQSNLSDASAQVGTRDFPVVGSTQRFFEAIQSEPAGQVAPFELGMSGLPRTPARLLPTSSTRFSAHTLSWTHGAPESVEP
jgi:hypothetical protein